MRKFNVAGMSFGKPVGLNSYFQADWMQKSMQPLLMPVGIMVVLSMMILPIPPLGLDILFTFNIAISLTVLIASLYTQRPLDFASFPTVLLLTTLVRLSLNVASTRVVLLEGHKGTDAAGKVIEAFGHFLVGGNLAVGLVVFSILMVINFIVITKGAGRIAEVSARFTLDAMPGKQMSIDADLNAGMINEETARTRRREIAQEAEFYGAMDGASKFVRGDAIAGILILFINIIGGLIIGIAQHNLSFADAGHKYLILSIGDGLVAQVPSLIISVAAGLVVARVGQGDDIGSQMAKQLGASPYPLALSALMLGLLGLIPGMPNLVFLLLAGLFSFGAYRAHRGLKKASAVLTDTDDRVKQAITPVAEATWEDLVPVDPLSIELGYRLIPLVEVRNDSDLIKRIRAIRKKFAQDIGFLPPVVHIRDNLELRPTFYQILIKGVRIAEGEVFVGQMLAINPGRVNAVLPGTQTNDPAFGLPATWISEDLKEEAASEGYTVVDPSTVITTHLSHILQTHAAQILGRAEVNELLTHLSKADSKMVEDLVPKLLDLSTVQKVLQNLLDEKIHIRDVRTIVETLLEWAPRTKDALELTAMVRIALGQAIVQSLSGLDTELQVLVLDPKLEQMVIQANQAAGGQGGGLDPNLAETLARHTAQAVQAQEALGKPAVLLVADSVRLLLSRLLRRSAPSLRVVSHSEVPESKPIRVMQVIGNPTR